MVTSRVASSSLHLQSLSDIAGVQSSLNKLTKQISSGKIASSYAELNGIVERVSGYESKIKRIDIYSTTNNSVSIRLKTMDQALSGLQDVAQDYASILTLKRGPSNNAFDFKKQSEQLLEQAAAILNIEVEGRYLFSGSATNTAPIKNPIPDLKASGIPDDNYYQGNGDVLTARVSDSVEIDYGITGNNAAFQKLFAAIRTGIESSENGDDDAGLAKSVTLINEAINELATTRADINTNIVNLDSIGDGLERQKLYWKEALGDDTDTDIAEATIKLSIDQTILQATFQAFSNVSKLKLTDYL